MFERIGSAVSKDETARGSGPVWLVVVGLAGAALWWWRSGAESATEPVAAGPGDAPAQTIATSLPEVRPELTVTPRFADRATVAGTVRDPRGQPVAGAQVCAANHCGGAGVEGQGEAGLHEDRARRPLPPRGAVPGAPRDPGERPGFAPGKYQHGEGASRRDWIELRPKMEALGIDIALEDGGVEVHGFVKDLSGGPIEGAQVAIDAAFAWTGTSTGRSRRG